MPRIIVDGVEWHPDDCDRITGRPLDAEPAEPALESVAVDPPGVLDAAGVTGGPGGWYRLPDGTSVRGVDDALAAAYELTGTA